MARFDIKKVSDGTVIKYSGKPTYHGTYLKPSYLEFTTISSPIPIAWEIGDYVEYGRTGLTYRLHDIPQPTKKARNGDAGESFEYSNVQFFADTKCLDDVPFRDLVMEQGQTTSFHFSTLNSVDTFENVAGIAARIQQNMVNFYGSGTWSVVVSPNVPSSFAVGEAREFSVSGVSCLGALDKIYEVWPELGWCYSLVNGVHTITIGASNVRTSGNTTNEFKYGLGQGLTAIKKTQVNKDTFCNRIYAYGSSRNLVSRYYNGKSIYEAAKVYIPNLMIPLAQWGTTSNLPDASKAYLQAAGVGAGEIRARHIYFDGSEQKEIYPSLSECTLDLLRSAKTALGKTGAGSPDYFPQSSGSSRIDEILSVVSSPADNGLVALNGSKYLEDVTTALAAASGSITATTLTQTLELTLGTHQFGISGKATIDPATTFDVVLSSTAHVPASMRVRMLANDEVIADKLPDYLQSGTLTFVLPALSLDVTASRSVTLKIRLEIVWSDASHVVPSTYSLLASNLSWRVSGSYAKTFKIQTRQLGFDVMERAALSGNGNPTIAFKDGACIAKSFSIKTAVYDSATDTWTLEVYRGTDTSVGMTYPNTTYPVAAGNHFVLLDIAMPDEYVEMASSRLYAEASSLLTKLSQIEPFYEPSVDAKVITHNIASHEGDDTYVLREGKYMHITDSDVASSGIYVIIDTLTINEGESSIPTYHVTLRERKRESYTQSIESTIQSLTSIGSSSSSSSSGGGSGSVKSIDAIGHDGIEVDGGPITEEGMLDIHLASGRVLPLQSDWASLVAMAGFFESVSDGNGGQCVKVKSPYTGLYAEGFISAFGMGTGGGGGSQQIRIDGSTNYVDYSDPSYVNLQLTQYLASKQLGFDVVVVQSLPSASAATMRKIYLIAKSTAGQQDVYYEWITVDNNGTYTWERIGSTEVDLTNYYTKTEADGRYLQLSGGTVNGYLTVNGNVGESGLITYAPTFHYGSVNIQSSGSLELYNNPPINVFLTSGSWSAIKFLVQDTSRQSFFGRDDSYWGTFIQHYTNAATSSILGIRDDAPYFYSDTLSSKGPHAIYHAGNSNKSDVDWTCNYLAAKQAYFEGQWDIAIRTRGAIQYINSDNTSVGYLFIKDGNLLMKANANWTSEYLVYDQSNCNKSDVDWQCRNLTASGTLSVSGVTTLGNNLTVSGNVLPNADNTRDLGTSVNKWNNIYGNNVFSGGYGVLTEGNYDEILDNVYAGINHNHDSRYSLSSHNHDSAYIKLNGTTNIGNNLTLAQGSTVTLSIADLVLASGDLSVGGDTTIGGNLTVSGNTTTKLLTASDNSNNCTILQGMSIIFQQSNNTSVQLYKDNSSLLLCSNSSLAVNKGNNNGTFVQIGNIRLVYNSSENAIVFEHVTSGQVANLYATGGVAAGGIGSGPNPVQWGTETDSYVPLNVYGTTKNLLTTAYRGTTKCYVASDNYTVADQIEAVYITSEITLTLPSNPSAGRHFKVYCETENGFKVAKSGASSEQAIATVFLGGLDEAINLLQGQNLYDEIYSVTLSYLKQCAFDFIFINNKWVISPLIELN